MSAHWLPSEKWYCPNLAATCAPRSLCNCRSQIQRALVFLLRLQRCQRQPLTSLAPYQSFAQSQRGPMQCAARCSWALGAPSRRSWAIPTGLLTQPARRRQRVWTLHTTQQAVRQQHQHHQGLDKQQLSWQDLHRAAQIAAWSGLCYLLPDELQAAIQQQHKGLNLVAAGRNGYTSWFVADGVVPAAQFCSTISSRSSSNGNGHNTSSSVNHAGGSAVSHDAAVTVGGVCTRVPQGTRERFVFLRGVQWSAPDINNTQLSQALMSLWPTRFPTGSITSISSSGSSSGQSAAAGAAGSSPLVAHAGVAGIAQDLFSQLRPYMQQADDVGMPLCFAGHSLGGSLAMLMLVQHQMHRRDRQQQPRPSCYTFGSPPVLAHERGGGGGPVLQALGLPPDAINSFVLEMDPVPRALLSVDPTFQALSGWSAVKGLLQLRELFVGSGSPLSPGRFLFESVGQVHLIKWTPEGGSQVVPLNAAEIEQELSLLTPTNKQQPGSSGSNQQLAAAGAAAKAAEQQAQEGGGLAAAPAAAAAGAAGALMNSLRAWLDHHHRSYAQELEAAALRGVRVELAAEQQQLRQQQQQAVGGPTQAPAGKQVPPPPPPQQQQQDVLEEAHKRS